MQLPSPVHKAIELLNLAGWEAYVVGGCVRDSMFGRQPDDWDVTTSALPSQMCEVFSNYRTIETGIQHGTLTVIIDEMPLEITTFRVDGAYSDGRHPDAVTFSKTLVEDLARRDFTINAMAYHPLHGLVDPFDGQTDLSAEMIRCVGNPKQRFREDALRIMRALRFAAELGFEIERDTEVALRELASSVSLVSTERITTELCKLICGRFAGAVLDKYADVLAAGVCDFSYNDVNELLSLVPAQVIPRLAALFWDNHASSKDVARILRGWRLDNRTVQLVSLLVDCKGMPCVTDTHLLKLLNRLDVDLAWIYLALERADEDVKERLKRKLSEACCYKLSMLDIKGDDLLEVGIPNGPVVGYVLNALLEAVMNGDCLNQKTELLRFAAHIKTPVQ